MYELRTDAFFDSAHFLADYHGKCENLHGHRWRVEVTIGSPELASFGTERDMVRDFGDFKRAVRELAAEFDHTLIVEEGTLSKKLERLLEKEGFSVLVVPFRTTAENFARHFFERLQQDGLPVLEVEVDETPDNRAVYRKER